MRGSLLALLALISACMQSHSAQAVEIRQEDCVTCHTLDYEASSLPPHAPSGFPTTCADCHRTSDWQPALGGLHPEPPFAVTSGPHGGVKCLACHDLDILAPSTAGANTNCIQCHPDSKGQRNSHPAGTRGPQGQTYAYTADVPNFCLTCHPAGRANKHPKDRFPLTGNHNRACTTCHDPNIQPNNAANTTCLNSGCHSLGEEDRQHREERRYPTTRGDGSNRHFCLACHPSGGGGD